MKKTENMKYESRTLSHISGSGVEDFIKSFKEEVDRNIPLEYHDSAYFSVETEGIPYSDGERAIILVTWTRPETDAERLERESMEQRHREWRRMEYERLKKEFE